MAEITKEQFKVVGKNTKTMESISRPNIGYWQDAWRRIRKNKIAFFSLCLIGLYVLMAIFVPMFSKYDIATQSVAEMNQSFSKAHWFGTDSLGRRSLGSCMVWCESISDNWFCGQHHQCNRWIYHGWYLRILRWQDRYGYPACR